MSDTWSSEKIGVAVSLSVIPLVVGLFMTMIWPPGQWFNSLVKPCWNPPRWLYMIIWAILYPLLGVSMTMALYGKNNWVGWILPVINLLATLLFIPIVFGLHSLYGGVVVTFLCLILGIGVLWEFSSLHEYVASGLMVPYIVWMLFATYLAYSFYSLNQGPCAPVSRRRKSSRKSC